MTGHRQMANIAPACAMHCPMGLFKLILLSKLCQSLYPIWQITPVTAQNAHCKYCAPVQTLVPIYHAVDTPWLSLQEVPRDEHHP